MEKSQTPCFSSSKIPPPPVRLIRHAEGYHNAYKIPEHDPALTNKGVRQAQKIKTHADLVLCSPMRRCKETLEYSGITYGECRVDPMVRERGSGRCDFFVDEEYVKEPQDVFEKRVLSFYRRLKGLSKRYKTIIIITHCTFISTLHRLVHRRPISSNNAQVLPFKMNYRLRC